MKPKINAQKKGKTLQPTEQPNSKEWNLELFSLSARKNIVFKEVGFLESPKFFSSLLVLPSKDSGPKDRGITSDEPFIYSMIPRERSLVPRRKKGIHHGFANQSMFDHLTVVMRCCSALTDCTWGIIVVLCPDCITASFGINCYHLFLRGKKRKTKKRRKGKKGGGFFFPPPLSHKFIYVYVTGGSAVIISRAWSRRRHFCP